MKSRLTFLFLVSLMFFLKNPANWNIYAQNTPVSDFEYETDEGSWISLDISPDGQKIVFDLLGHLYQMPISGGEAEAITKGKSFNNFPRYSPDGQQLLYTSDEEGSEDLWVMNLENGKSQNVSKMGLPVFQGTWSKDGRHLYGTALNMKVRFPAYQFNFYGTQQQLIPAGGREPVNHFTYHPSKDFLYFEHNISGDIYGGGGPQIKTYDLKTGEIQTLIQKRGGAASPRISPDGEWLSYIHRNDQKTELMLHNLSNRKERVLSNGLDWGRFESRAFYGCYSNYAWHPNGQEIFISFGGGIHAIKIEDGTTRKIPFKATIKREIAKTHRVKVDFDTDDESKTRVHRWGIPTSQGIVYETLGDLYLLKDGKPQALTSTSAHENHPIYEEKTNRVYFSRWTDDDLGNVYRLDLGSGRETQISSRPSQYGAIAISPVDGSIAVIRGAGGLIDGQHIEGQTGFEIVHIDQEGKEHHITDLQWSGNRYAKRPPTILWKQGYIYFSEYVGDVLTLKRIRPDGSDEAALYKLSHATRAILSPELKWIAFREYHRTFITPFEFSGQILTVSAADGKGFCKRVDDALDGDFTEWTVDGQGLYWTRGKFLVEKSLEDVLAGNEKLKKTELSVSFRMSTPTSTIALRNVRILTMNEKQEVLENATVLIENNRIKAVGKGVKVPAGAKIYNLRGHTIMPGMFDAHGHYGSPISALNTIEQYHYGLRANLAYGVTTMYDVYGTTQKDFWLDDMQRAGKMVGSRIFSVGDPVFVTKYRTKMHRPITSLEDALEIARFNKDHGATALKDYSNHTRKARQYLIEACRLDGLNLVTESFSNPQMNLTQIIDGFTGIEHTIGLTPLYNDIIQLFAHTEIGMTPTLIVVYNGVSGENYFYNRERIWEDKKLLNFFRKDELLAHRRPTHYFEDDYYHMQMAKELKKLHQAGVLLQMGAHGQKMGIGAHWEMEMFVHGGFTPLEAIQIATINGFKHHGLDHELGSIEAGKLADLVILTKNPINDIRNTRSIKYVMKNGVLYDGFDATPIYPEKGEKVKMYFK